jgi:hypothetical protein
MKPESRPPAVLRRREGTCFSSPSDDEVGAHKGAIRACDVRAADLQEEPTKRLEEQTLTLLHDGVSSDPTKTAARGEHRCERSEPLGTVSAASEAIRTVG